MATRLSDCNKDRPKNLPDTCRIPGSSGESVNHSPLFPNIHFNKEWYSLSALDVVFLNNKPTSMPVCGRHDSAFRSRPIRLRRLAMRPRSIGTGGIGEFLPCYYYTTTWASDCTAVAHVLSGYVTACIEFGAFENARNKCGGIATFDAMCAVQCILVDRMLMGPELKHYWLRFRVFGWLTAGLTPPSTAPYSINNRRRTQPWIPVNYEADNRNCLHAPLRSDPYI